MTDLDRGALLSRGALLAGATMLGPAAFGTITAGAPAASGLRWTPAVEGDYGPLAPVAATNDPCEYLALPAGFSYTVLGRTGGPMGDGNPTPACPEGMAAFAGPGGTVRLIRNHRGGGAGSVLGPAATRYDPSGGGGTTTLDYDPATRSLVRDFVSLNGTVANRSGGVVAIAGEPGWMTTEKTTAGPPRWGREHGYTFFVPAGADGPVKAEPFRAMGRFSHGAVVHDGRTGVFYQVEDAGPGRGSGFYRYVPASADARRGRLQMLAVKAWPRADLREGQRLFKPFAVEWVDIADPDPATVVDAPAPGATSVFAQGFAAGGARFNRLEGVWSGANSVFFASTGGGDAKSGTAPDGAGTPVSARRPGVGLRPGDGQPVDGDGFEEGFGQIWEYRPRSSSAGQLVLVFESPGRDVLDSPGRLTVTPRGGVLLCENAAAGGGPRRQPAAGGRGSRLVGLSVGGEAFELAVNRFNASELTGACFSPDATTLFVNIFGTGAPGSGMTCAITGPWEHGAL